MRATTTKNSFILVCILSLIFPYTFNDSELLSALNLYIVIGLEEIIVMSIMTNIFCYNIIRLSLVILNLNKLNTHIKLLGVAVFCYLIFVNTQGN